MYNVTPLTQELKTIVTHNAQMLRYLEALNHEVPYTQRSWLYEDVSNADLVLDGWMEKLQELEAGTQFQRNVFQFDTSQLEKWGPQGGHEPISKLMDSVVLPTFSGSKTTDYPAFRTREWSRAKSQATRLLMANGRVSRLRPASYEHVIDDMRARDTLESNSGFPDFKRRNIQEVKDRALEDARSGRWKMYPAIALFRRYNGKTRLVWMFPMSANLVEGSFFQPLQSALMVSPLSKEFLAPWTGFEQVRRVVERAYKQNQFVAASDFSATDAHFQLAVSREVFDVLEQLYQPQFREQLWDSIKHMHTIPLVVGPNEMIQGSHGVSSGSNWTNFVETIFDLILACYVNQHVSVSGLYAIGDDMSWVSDSYNPKFAEILEDLAKGAGMEVKADKTTNDRDKVKSLQRLFQRGYGLDGHIRAVYSTVRALKSSIFPERFHNPKLWNSDMFCARQFMILENCVDHPLFSEFVRFVCAGQKDLVPFAHKSEAALTRITRESKLIPGLNPTYNQERRDSSLASFASIRLARTF